MKLYPLILQAFSFFNSSVALDDISDRSVMQLWFELQSQPTKSAGDVFDVMWQYCIALQVT